MLKDDENVASRISLVGLEEREERRRRRRRRTRVRKREVEETGGTGGRLEGRRARSKERDRETHGQHDMTGQEFELREQDRWLPIANVARLMKNTLPGTAKVSKDAKECMQECVSEFISFVTSEASDRCLMEKRKTINGEDVLYSLHTLGFENYAEVLKIYLAKYRQQQALKQERGEIRQKKKKKPAADSVGGEQQQPQQQEMRNDGDEYEYPMDESMAVIRGNVDEKWAKTGPPAGTTPTSPKDTAGGYDQSYVSQLYEQSYAGVSMNMANPDYRVGASEGIMAKKEHELQRLKLKEGDAGAEGAANVGGTVGKSPGQEESRMPLPLDTDSIGLGMDVDEDVDVGVGVNVHLGNTESLDEISSRLNRDAGPENGGPGVSPTSTGASPTATKTATTNTTSAAAADTDIDAAGPTSATADVAKDEPLPGKTPATTSTSDLLLLNDNLASVTETEEIAGLTSGHSVLYNFE